MTWIFEYAIIGHYPGPWLGRTKPFVRFAGGRSRRKLERIAKRMNESGEAFCRVSLTKRKAPGS